MADVAQLGLAVDSRGVVRGTSDLERMSGAARRTESATSKMAQTIERDVGRIQGTLSNAQRLLVGFFSVAGAARLATGLGRVADEYANIQAKLRLVTADQAGLGRASEQVFAISQRTYSSLDSTATLVSRTTRALISNGEEAGRALTKSLALSETIQQAFAVSGATNAEASNAIIQLSQGLAAGALRGEEFNSVAEQGSRITQALARYLKLTTGELRAMAQEGKLTAEVVQNALSAEAATIAAEFEKLPMTISRSLVVLDNAWTKFIGEADTAAGVSRTVAEAIAGIGSNLGPIISGLTNIAALTLAAFAGKGLQAVANYGRGIAVATAAQSALLDIERQSAIAAAQTAQARAVDLARTLEVVGAARQEVAVKLQVAAAERDRALRTLEATKNIGFQSAALRQHRIATDELTAAQLRLRGVTNELAVLGQQQARLQTQLATGAAAQVAAQARVAGALTGTQAMLASVTGAVSRFGAGLLSLAGGPIGVTIAVLGAMYFSMKNAEQAAVAFEGRVKSVTQALDDFNRTGLQGDLEGLFNPDSGSNRAADLIAEINSELQSLNVLALEAERRMEFGRGGGADLARVTERTAELNAKLETLRPRLEEARNAFVGFVREALSFGKSQQTVARDMNDWYQDMSKGSGKLQEQIIKLRDGEQALQEYIAMQAAGVKSTAELTDGQRLEIERRVELQKTLDGLNNTRKESVREERASEKQARQTAKAVEDVEKAYADYAVTLARLRAEGLGPIEKAEAEHAARLLEIETQLADGTIPALEQYYEALDLAAGANARATKDAEKQVAAMLEQQGAAQALLAEMDTELALLGMSSIERRKAVAVMQAEYAMRQAIQSAQAADRGYTEAEIAGLMETARMRALAIDQAAEFSAATEQAAQDYQRVWTNAANGVGDALTTAMFDGADAGADAIKDVMENLARDLIRFWIQQKIIIPLQQQLMGGAGAGGGGIGSLLGGSGAGGSSAGAGGLGGLFGGANDWGQFGSESAYNAAAAGGPPVEMAGTGSSALSNFAGAAGFVIGTYNVYENFRNGEGGAEGALSGAVSGASAGASIGSIVPGIGTLFGAAVGAIIGGLAGLFGGAKDPDLRLGGVGVTRKPEETFETAFGMQQIGVRGGTSSFDMQNLVIDFDEQLAAVVGSFSNGAEQMTAVGAALDAWSIDLEGSAITAENVLGSRFNAILGTFNDDIRQFVGTAGDMEERLARFADAAFIDAAVNATDPLIDNFADLAAILEANQVEGEALQQTYSRIGASTALFESALDNAGITLDLTRVEFVQFATDITDAAGGLQAASELWAAYFETFYTAEERAAASMATARSRADSEFSDIGLSAADFLGEGGAAAFRTAIEAVFATGSAEAIVQWLEAAAALGVVIDLQGLATTATQDNTAALEAAAEAERARTEAMLEYASIVTDINLQLLDASGASDYARALGEIGVSERQNVDTLNAAAVAAGLAAASELDVAAAYQLSAIQRARAERQLTESARGVVAQLYSPMTALDAQISALQASESAASSAMSNLGESISNVGQTASEIANAMLGPFSSLKGRAKADYALKALAEGSVSLDAALQAGSSVYASGADFNSFRDQAFALAANQPQEQNTPAAIGTSVSRAMQELLDQRAVLEDEQTRAERFGLAGQLAQQVADLSLARGTGFAEVLESLGITGSQLQTDLGLTSEAALMEYLGALQTETQTFAEMWTRATFGEQMIVDAINAAWMLQNQIPDPLLNPPELPPIEAGNDPLARPNELEEAQAAQIERLETAIVTLTTQQAEQSQLIAALLAQIAGNTAQSAGTLGQIESGNIVERVRQVGQQTRIDAKPKPRVAVKP